MRVGSHEVGVPEVGIIERSAKNSSKDATSLYAAGECAARRSPPPVPVELHWKYG